jgi:hypothetical protein
MTTHRWTGAVGGSRFVCATCAKVFNGPEWQVPLEACQPGGNVVPFARPTAQPKAYQS